MAVFIFVFVLFRIARSPAFSLVILTQLTTIHYSYFTIFSFIKGSNWLTLITFTTYLCLHSLIFLWNCEHFNTCNCAYKSYLTCNNSLCNTLSVFACFFFDTFFLSLFSYTLSFFTFLS